MGDRDLTPDHRRQDRLGFDEAVFCEGKTVAQIERLLVRAEESGNSLLLTRLLAAQHEALPARLREGLDYDDLSRTGIFGDVSQHSHPPRAGILTAGTSDVAVARESARTLAYYGEPVAELYDLGVAGLWRLQERLEEIRRLAVLIVVAGMDCALPSVLGGLVPQPVIAVPTSVGYGVSAGGRAALDAALGSCAPGVVVVNIDNGYGAACAALRMLRSCHAGA